ncbi:MAG: HEAT repeat domain-containing protein [Candidatus Muirbacterium halophilum]|nr:HEAT repeat domain-containing protein [Candidatus Muirbacterium halophilum]
MTRNIVEVLRIVNSEEFIGEYISNEIAEKYPEIKEDFYANYIEMESDDKIKFFRLFGFMGKDQKFLEFSFRILNEQELDNVKASIIRAVGDTADVDYIPRLASYLKHSERRIRANTVEALSKIGDRKIVDLLLPVMETEKDNRVLANTAIALWQFEEIREKVKETFSKMIKNDEKWMRASALYAFGETQIEDFLHYLLSSLEDEDEDVCRNAIIALVGYSEILTKKN